MKLLQPGIETCSDRTSWRVRLFAVPCSRSVRYSPVADVQGQESQQMSTLDGCWMYPHWTTAYWRTGSTSPFVRCLPQFLLLKRMKRWKLNLVNGDDRASITRPGGVANPCTVGAISCAIIRSATLRSFLSPANAI